ncbi:UNVERIFIED_CONTAM: hypothetical protein HDU68_010728 [Siphonaria sp. JEL0065]|nr:hypothetical protein HDU68_010728 [Siphonaria sp. JEL0065]
MDPQTRVVLYTPVESLKYPEAHHVFENLVVFVTSQIGSNQMTALVLDCQNVHHVDSTGLEMLICIKEFLADHTGFNIPIHFYNTKPHLLSQFGRVNSYDPFSPASPVSAASSSVYSSPYTPALNSAGVSPVFESYPSPTPEANPTRVRPSRSASLNPKGQRSYPIYEGQPPLPNSQSEYGSVPAISVHRTRSNGSTMPNANYARSSSPGSATMSVLSANPSRSSSETSLSGVTPTAGTTPTSTGGKKGKSFFGRFKVTKKDSSDSESDSETDDEVNPLKGTSADHAGFKSIYAKELRRFKKREAAAAAAAAARS